MSKQNLTNKSVSIENDSPHNEPATGMALSGGTRSELREVLRGKIDPDKADDCQLNKLISSRTP